MNSILYLYYVMLYYIISLLARRLYVSIDSVVDISEIPYANCRHICRLYRSCVHIPKYRELNGIKKSLTRYFISGLPWLG